ncbi:MAG: alpha/beta fold hydrolase [Propioniciclava sp.]|uniref:alpha/beta fold hydrolase n=1 Tax=Propioniciclava sp. TaxID=2038686 RepID=UPI0039E688A7
MLTRDARPESVVTTPDPLADTPLCDQLEAVIAAVGEGSIAIRDAGAATVSYGELGALCRSFAQAGAGESPVAVLGGSARALAAAVAVAYAGRPLALLDQQLPIDRLRQILRTSRATVTIVDDELAAVADEAGAVGVLSVTDAWRDGLPAAGEPVRPSGRTPATLVYTSGSTGAPKGVILSHASVVNGAATTRREFGLGPGDVCAMLLPPAYAAGQEVLFMSVLNGCLLESFDPRQRPVGEIAAWLTERNVTTLHCTPSMLRHLNGSLARESYPGVRLVTTCGEPVHGRDVAAARGYLPNAGYANYVGSSETGHLTFFHLGADEEVPAGQIPAGRITINKCITPVSEVGEPLAPGETGVLEVSSPFLASGYWGDPERTAEVFGDRGDDRVFRTGDRGSVRDGVLTLAGRKDDAVKIRGYLVEPAEVEAALRGIDEVIDAVVVADAAAGRLIGYVVPDPARRTPSLAQLRAGLARRLPDWMVPQAIVLMDALPRTERGKVDRAALPTPAARPQPALPADRWQALVSAVWCDVLHVEAVGPDESFAELGGDSLAVEEMLAVLGQEGIDLHGSDLAAAPTLAAFAARVRQSAEHRTPTGDGVMVTLREGEPGDVPVYCFSGAGGPAYLFTDLARKMGEGHAVHAFQVRGLERRAIPDWSVRRAAKRYAGLIERRQRPGRVVLVGHSLGGLFALETAHLLRARGYDIALTVLLDTLLPGNLAQLGGDQAPQIRTPGGRKQTRRELWSTRLQLLGAGLVRYQPAVRDQVFFQHGLRLTEWYRVRPWDGPTEVFLTPENLDDRGWWRHVLTGEYALHEVECGHVAILKPPYVEAIAASVASAVDVRVG